ncbi:MAG TPA: uroporphyrinogen decarboxylase family protein [Candidatus Lokiarchaeia archaeon]|nr:uroporphyrinogen decarboxylase family protein [Candidatus Lokiarchaeia archaeon]
MNARDLSFAAIDGIPDEIPFNPIIMHLAATIIDVDYSRVYCEKPEVMVEGQIKCTKFFGIHHVHVMSDAFREASAWGVKVYLDGHTPVAADGGSLDWQEFDSIETPNLLESPRIVQRLEAVKLLRQAAPDQCLVGWIEAPFAEISSIFSLVEAVKIFGKKNWPTIYKRLLDRIVPVQLEFAKLQIEAGADIIGAGDSAISQIGPRRYKAATLDATRDLFTELRKQVPVIYHCCGDNSIVDKDGNDMLELIASTGASVIDIDTQVDIAMAKEKVGDKVCLRGNTNTTLLGDANMPLERIVPAIASNIEAGKSGGKYWYAAGCEWPWAPRDMAFRDMAAAKALVEKLGKYN